MVIGLIFVENQYLNSIDLKLIIRLLFDFRNSNLFEFARKKKSYTLRLFIHPIPNPIICSSLNLYVVLGDAYEKITRLPDGSITV